MKHWTLACLASVTITAMLWTTTATAVEPGQAAPEVKLDLPDGVSNLTALKGQVVYLDFWASYCGPCRKSFPWMNDMHARYGSKGLRVVGVNVDEKRSDADRFLSQVPAQFAIAFDPKQESPARYGIRGMPTAVLIGADGKVIRTHTGFHDDQRAELEAAIVQALAKR